MNRKTPLAMLGLLSGASFVFVFACISEDAPPSNPNQQDGSIVVPDGGNVLDSQPPPQPAAPVFVLPKDDSGATERPVALGATDSSLVWATSTGSIWTCERTNCSATAKPIVTAGMTPASFAGASGIYPTLDSITAVAADATHVYWAAYLGPATLGGAGVVFRAALTGAPTVLAFAARGFTAGLVVDNTNVYWMNFGAGNTSLYRCAKDACFSNLAMPTLVTSPTLSNQQPDPLECPAEADKRCWFTGPLTLTPNTIKFTDCKRLGQLGKAWTIAKTAASAPATPRVDDGFACLTSVAAIGDVDYVTQYGPMPDGGPGRATSGGRVLRIVPGVGVSAVVDALSQPDNIVTDGANLYWIETGSGKIQRCDKSGCLGANTPTTLAINQAGATGLLVVGNNLYWVNSAGTEIMTAGK
jgi:hypothetical protein